MSFSSAQLLSALDAMPSRSAAILGFRCVKAFPRPRCAQLYGVTPEAFDAMLLRASNDLARALRLPVVEETPDFAAALRDTLEPGGIPDTFPAVAALCVEKATLAQALRRESAADLPMSKGEKWFRRLAIVIVLALTAYFYWQEHYGSPKLTARPGQPSRVQR
ncbi:MAG: hypothetical protein K1X64_07045 [Myxococcaceae bacterium]|nr:hypothetical protein [Myxococcaceae bacterium]